MILSIPKAQAPGWFVPRIFISRNQRIVVLDDDQTIHQIWKGRFESTIGKALDLTLEHMGSSTAFRKFYGQNFADLENALFLIDFELIGERETGLDLIEQLGIQKQAILVTSRY